MKDVADRNTAEGSSCDSFVDPETVAVNAAGIRSVFSNFQMLAGIPLYNTATSAATRAQRFPLCFLTNLPLMILSTVIINHAPVVPLSIPSVHRILDGSIADSPHP